MPINTSDDHLITTGGDLNSALRQWFNKRDGTAYTDIAFSHKNFLQTGGRTAADSSRAVVEENAGAAGKETT